MKQRNPIAVFILGLVTFGIYSLYWAVKTKGEMNRMGERIPTAWMILIPFIGAIWWFWKYSEGVGHVTKEKMSGIMAFILLLLLGNIGQAIVQDYFNKITVEVPVQAVTNPIIAPTEETSTIVMPTQEAPVDAIIAPVEQTYEMPQTPIEPSVPVQQPAPMTNVTPAATPPTTPFGPTPL